MNTKNAASAAIISIALAAGPGAMQASAATTAPQDPVASAISPLLKIVDSRQLKKIVDDVVLVVERLSSNHNETVLSLG